MSETPQAAAGSRWTDHPLLAGAADLLAVAIAVSLPWSTSATSILAAIWLIILILVFDIRGLCRVLATSAGGLPVVIWLLAVVGILWADAPLAAQFAALSGLHKLLLIPLGIVQFRQSDKGPWVLGGFLASSTALLAVSWWVWFWPELWVREILLPGVPVKDYIAQSGAFMICAFALLHAAFNAWGKGRRDQAFGCVAWAAIFFANIAFVATARAALIAYLALAGLLGFQRFAWKGAVGIVLVAGILGLGALSSSPYLQTRLKAVDQEVATYEADGPLTSTGLRLEIWEKAVRFIAESPFVGHGTGSIDPLLRQAAEEDKDANGVVTVNLHNMTMQLSVQLGMLGAVVLYAMWLAHFWLFVRATSGAESPTARFVAMIGAALVAQNIIGSMFFAYLADFNTGWLYVLGVGVIAGMVMRDRDAQARTRSS